MRLLTLSVFALVGLALTASDASAFGGRKKKGCEAPACEPVCAAPAPVCAAPAPVCAAPVPVCVAPAPVCVAPAPVCAPVCAPAPTCAPVCEPACEPAKKKCGLFGGRKKRC